MPERCGCKDYSPQDMGGPTPCTNCRHGYHDDFTGCAAVPADLPPVGPDPEEHVWLGDGSAFVESGEVRPATIGEFYLLGPYVRKCLVPTRSSHPILRRKEANSRG